MKNLLKAKTYLIYFGFAILLILVIVISDFNIKPGQPHETAPYTATKETSPSKLKGVYTEYQIGWNDIYPGKTKMEEVGTGSIFGNIISEVKDNDGNTLYSYDAIGKYLPVKVTVDKNGVIQKIDLPNLHSKTGDYPDYLEENELANNPDIDMYVQNTYYLKAYVFLRQGIEFLVGEQSKQVFNIVYFSPMTKEQFMEKYGKDLSDTLSLPQEGY